MRSPLSWPTSMHRGVAPTGRTMLITYLFFLLILLSPTQLGKHWWPAWSLVNGVRVDYLSPTLYVTDILLILLLIVTFKNQKTKNKKQTLKIPRFFLLLFTVYCFLLTFFSLRPLLALYWTARYFEIPLVAYLIFVLGKNVRAIIPTALSLGVLFSVTLGLTQMIIGKTTGLFWIIGERSFTISSPGISTISLLGQTVLRPYATFPHPNALAGWLAVSFFLIPLLGNRQTLGQVFSRIVALVGVIVSASRAALFFLLVALSAGVWIPKISNALFIAFPRDSLEERVVLNGAALRIFLQHPLFGVGPGHFIVELPKYLPPDRWILQPVHNVFLLLLSEFGVIGTTMGLMCLIGLLRLIRSTQLPKQWLPILIVLLGTGLADHYWIAAQQNRILLGITLGIFLGKVKRLTG